jgi:hypothetical protein
LGKNELRGMVLAFLRQRPARVHPTDIGKELGRSSGLSATPASSW